MNTAVATKSETATTITDYLNSTGRINWQDVYADDGDAIINPTDTTLLALAYRLQCNAIYRNTSEPPVYEDIRLPDSEIIAALRTVRADDYEWNDEDKQDSWDAMQDARVAAINDADIKTNGPLAGRVKSNVPIIAVATGGVKQAALYNSAQAFADALGTSNRLPAIFDAYDEAKNTTRNSVVLVYCELMAAVKRGDIALASVLAMPEPGSVAPDKKSPKAVKEGELYDRIQMTAGKRGMTSIYMLVVRDLPFGTAVVERAEKAAADYTTVKNYENERKTKAAQDKLKNYKALIIDAVKVTKQVAAIAAKYPDLVVSFEETNAMHPTPIGISDKTNVKAGEAPFSVQQFLRFDMAKAQPTKETGRYDLASLVKTAERVEDPNISQWTNVPQMLVGITQMNGFLSNYRGPLQKYVNANPTDGPALVRKLLLLAEDLKITAKAISPK